MTPETISSESRNPKRQRRWPYAPVEPGTPAVEPGNLACRLPPPELRERAREIRQSFLPGIVAVDEIEDGFVYWFERTDEWFARVTDFALFESRCCDFLDFEIGLQAAGNRVSLRVSGPGDAKRFLAAARQADVPSGGRP